MPKITVYVPDGLVERVRELNPEVNVSQLVQNAVQSEIQRLEAQRDGSVAVRDRVNMAAMREKFQAVQAARAEADRVSYQAGYDWVLEHAESIPYETFERGKFSVIMAHAGDGLQGVRQIATSGQPAMRTSLVEQGVNAALRDVWATVGAELASGDDVLSPTDA
jgi:hypothetical protein